LAIRCSVQKSRQSSNVKVKVKGQGHRGQKKRKKCGILFGSRPLERGPRAAFFSRAVLGGVSTPVGTATPVGKSAHAV